MRKSIKNQTEENPRKGKEPGEHYVSEAWERKDG